MRVWIYPPLEGRLYPRLSCVARIDARRCQTSLNGKCERLRGGGGDI